LSPEIKTDSLYKLVRRVESDDLEAQIQALKELQKQPGFIAKKRISLDNSKATFKKRLINILFSLFRRKQKPVSASQIKSNNT
jgi:hydroxyethylthiazole kinase-like sugar kinase family protein